MTSRFWLLLFVSTWAIAASASPSCRDGSGQRVDWFIAIKRPKSFGYYEMTSAAPQWTISECSTREKCGSIYNTINQVYNLKSGNNVTIVYNGQRPPRGRGKYYAGHMKGVVGFEMGKTGFWVIHSVPKFPGQYRYNYPKSGKRYAQHFFCVTYNYSQLATIAKQLLISRALVYSHHVPEMVENEIPDIGSLVTLKKPDSSKRYRIRTLISAEGVKLKSFSKSRKYQVELYKDLVAPKLKTGLFMEGWVNGRGSLNSNCSGTFPVYRITSVKLKDKTWTTTRDHSKWAVSNNKSKPFVCLGDLNRQASQARRGGGTLCFANKKVWTAFRSMVDDYQECDDYEYEYDYDA